LKKHPDAEAKKFLADLHNTYHKGFWGNLREVIFALDLHSVEEEVDAIAEKDAEDKDGKTIEEDSTSTKENNTEGDIG